MPSHVRQGGCGSIIRGDGFLLTEEDVEANGMADTYAKRAVLAHRVPYKIRKEVESYNDLTTDNAMWIARATLLANSNQHPGMPARDTEASRARAAVAAATRRKHRAATCPIIAPCGINPQTGKKTTVMQRRLDQGGHALVRSGSGWSCICCKARSITWARLAPQQCRGDAATRWNSIASGRMPCSGPMPKKHTIMVSGQVTWCGTCGAYACSAPILLTRPCKGRPLIGSAGGLRGQLRLLRAGMHPRTRLPIPPPIPLRRWEELNSDVNRCKARDGPPPVVGTEGPPPPAIQDDGSLFTKAFLTRGLKRTKEGAGTAVERIRKRIRRAATEEKQEDAAKEQDIILDFLTPAEREDQDLIDFWKADDSRESAGVSSSSLARSSSEQQMQVRNHVTEQAVNAGTGERWSGSKRHSDDGSCIQLEPAKARRRLVGKQPSRGENRVRARTESQHSRSVTNHTLSGTSDNGGGVWSFAFPEEPQHSQQAGGLQPSAKMRRLRDPG